MIWNDTPVKTSKCCMESWRIQDISNHVRYKNNVRNTTSLVSKLFCGSRTVWAYIILFLDNFNWRRHEWWTWRTPKAGIWACYDNSRSFIICCTTVLNKTHLLNWVATYLYDQALWLHDYDNRRQKTIEIIFQQNESSTLINLLFQKSNHKTCSY
jgi:hypothetical protein